MKSKRLNLRHHLASCAAAAVPLLFGGTGCRVWVPAPKPGWGDVVVRRLSAPETVPAMRPEPVSPPAAHASPRRGAVPVPTRGPGRIAVLPAPPGSGWAAIAFTRSFRRALRLGPDVIVILGSLDVSPEGRFRVGRSLLPVGLHEAGDCRVIVFPGGGSGGAPSRVKVPGGQLLFLPATAVPSRLTQELHPLAPDNGLILFLDAPPSTPALEQAVRRSRARCAVFYPGVPPTSWFPAPAPGPGMFRVAFPEQEGPADPENVRDGLAAGLFWVTLGGRGPAATFLPAQALFPPEALFAGDQERRAAIRAAVSASPASDLDPTTVVVCTNPTDQTLTYHAAWQFAAAGFRVDPEVLEFTIEPKAQFRQRFRFLCERGLALKFARPAFVMTTNYRNRDGFEVPVRLEAVPPCILSGTVAWAATAPTVDGDVREWSAEGANLVNHPTQVVIGSEEWKGPEDLSASFFAAADRVNLYLAMVVQDDAPRENAPGAGGMHDYVDFFVAPSAGSGPENSNPPPLRVRVMPDGRFQVRSASAGGAASRVRAAARRNDRGYSVEVALPLDLVYPAGGHPKSIRLDAAVHEQDSDDARPVALFYSGNESDETSPALLGTFQFAGPPAPSEP